MVRVNKARSVYTWCIARAINKNNTMAGIDEGVVQVRADDEDEFTEGKLLLRDELHDYSAGLEVT